MRLQQSFNAFIGRISIARREALGVFFDGWSDQSVEILPKLLRASWASVESGIHLVAFFDIANGYKNWSLWFVVFTMGDLR